MSAVRDHAVLVPTSLGPAGCIVTEPAGDGPSRASVVLLPGGGPVGRSGVNAGWKRLAHELADRGATVLRADYYGVRESSVVAGTNRTGLPRPDVTLLDEITTWFRERAPAGELLMAGVCRGGRVAIHVAAANREVSRLFLVVPYMLTPPPPLKDAGRLGFGRTLERPLDPEATDDLDDLIGRIPVAVLLGDRDDQSLVEVRRRTGPRAGFEIEVVPGFKLHPVQSPDVQAVISGRTLAWVTSVIEGRDASPAYAEL